MNRRKNAKAQHLWGPPRFSGSGDSHANGHTHSTSTRTVMPIDSVRRFVHPPTPTHPPAFTRVRASARECRSASGGARTRSPLGTPGLQCTRMESLHGQVGVGCSFFLRSNWCLAPPLAPLAERRAGARRSARLRRFARRAYCRIRTGSQGRRVPQGALRPFHALVLPSLSRTVATPHAGPLHAYHAAGTARLIRKRPMAEAPMVIEPNAKSRVPPGPPIAFCFP